MDLFSFSIDKKSNNTNDLIKGNNENNILSVYEFYQYIKDIVQEVFNRGVWIKGVISSEIKEYDRYVFFDLKDENHDVNLTVFVLKHHFNKINNKLKDFKVVDKLQKDLPVLLFGNVSLQKKRFSVLLKVSDIEPSYTKNIIDNQKNITLAKLEQEGILDNQKKLQLPSILRKIAIITSGQGTSAKDIKSAIGEAARYIDIILFPVQVEGDVAIPKIIQTLKLVVKYKDKLNIDAVIIARGGGSSLDLSVFNSYELCKEVCLMPIPVISAIGHDKDELAIEYCSYKRPYPATPSGAGAFIKKHVLNNFLEFKEIFTKISEIISFSYYKHALNIKELVNEVSSIIKTTITKNAITIKSNLDFLKVYLPKLLDDNMLKITNLIDFINSHDPNNILKRGYVILWNKNQSKALKNTVEFTKYLKLKENIINIQFYDDKLSISINKPVKKQISKQKEEHNGK